jgi:dihydroorotase
MGLLIKGATTIARLLGDDSDDKRIVDVRIEEQQIVEIGDNLLPAENEQVIEASGLFLSPGLVDPQVHFREPGMEYKEDTASGSRAAVKGGFTAVVSMPNTAPVADNPEVVGFMVSKAKEVGVCKVYPTGALSTNLAGKDVTDFSALREAGAVAITDDGKGVQSDEIFRQAMVQAQKVGLPILDHSEDEQLSKGGAIHEGIVSEKYGIKGIGKDSESVHVARGCEMSQETGAHYHVLHVSTKASIDIIREAKKKGINVTVEVSPHHLLLCDEDIPEKGDGTLNANWKMNPPLRSRMDMEACQQALLDGTIDAIATDHAPHSAEEKAQHIEQAPFGIIGLETAFPLVYSHFVRSEKLPLSRCIDLMSQQAGKLFGLECGRIVEGSTADLVLFDLENAFDVTEDYFASRSQNSPFIGNTLFGKTQYTLVDGKVVFQAD